MIMVVGGWRNKQARGVVCFIDAILFISDKNKN